jgi:Holliday junction resolvase RusA-like endonuclease
MLTILLPLPPTANKLWVPVRTAGGAKMVKRKSYEDWSAMAKREVAQQRAGAAISGAFHAAILLPDDGPFDLDNMVKPLLDACQRGGAISNDKLCRRLWVDADDTRTGTALVELTPLPPAGCAPGGTKGTARMETV